MLCYASRLLFITPEFLFHVVVVLVVPLRVPLAPLFLFPPLTKNTRRLTLESRHTPGSFELAGSLACESAAEGI
jgi:hypothetical protein